MKGQVVLGGEQEEEENGSEVQGLGVVDSNNHQDSSAAPLGFAKLL